MGDKKLGNFLPHPLTTACFAISFLFFYLFATPLFNFPDIPWHLAAGKWIVENGTIPEMDLWAYAPQEVTWYNISWLWDILLSTIETHLGLEYIYIFFVTSLALLIACSYTWLISRKVKPEFAIATVFVLGLVIWHFANARPYNISFLFALLSHVLCYQAYRKENYMPLYIIFPVMMAVWGNIHGGFLAGFSVLGFYGIATLIERDYIAFRKLFLLGIASVITLIAFNYYHFGLVTATLRTLHSVATNFINEWQNFTFHAMMGPTVLLLSFLLVVNPRDKKIPIEERLMAYAWLFAATWSIRNFPFAAIFSMPALAISFSQTGKPKPFHVVDTAKARLGVIIITALLVSTTLIPSTRNTIFPGDRITSLKDPRAAVAYIKTHIPPETVIFNEYSLGGYLIYALERPKRVFIDGRAGTAYSEELITDIISARSLSTPEEFGKFIEKYHVGAIVVNKLHNISVIARLSEYHDQWHITFEDDNYLVLEKK